MVYIRWTHSLCVKPSTRCEEAYEPHNERDTARWIRARVSKSDTLSRFVTQKWPTARLLTRVIRQSLWCFKLT